MEKNYLISRLISIVFVFIPVFAFAQDDEPSIKIKTEEYDGGIIVDTYEKGAEKYRYIKKKNGDFYIEFGKMNYPIKWTLKDGTLIEGNDKKLRINIYGKEGVLILSDDRDYTSGLIKLDDFLNDEITTPKLFERFYSYSMDEDYFKGYIRPNEPDKILPFNHERFLEGYEETFLTLANCCYKIDDNGRMKFIGKKTKMKLLKGGEEDVCVYAIPTDSIIACEEMKDEEGRWYEKISYANGDVVFLDDGLSSGTHIHRDNGILKIIKSGENHWASYYYLNDGRIFKGKGNDCFKEIFIPGSWIMGYMKTETLCYPSLTPYTGTLINKDNTGIVIEKGLSEEEREKQAEQARKKKEESEKAGYDFACKKYGKKYVDAVLNHNIIVGMPEELLLLSCKNITLRQQVQGAKKYEIRGWGINNGVYKDVLTNNQLKWVVWVRNGRVSSVKNYNSKVSTKHI